MVVVEIGQQELRDRLLAAIKEGDLVIAQVAQLACAGGHSGIDAPRPQETVELERKYVLLMRPASVVVTGFIQYLCAQQSVSAVLTYVPFNTEQIAASWKHMPK